MNRSIPMLPDGLVFHQHYLEDTNMHREYPINATAAIYFSLMDGKRNLGDISKIIAQKYQQDDTSVTRDLEILSVQLEKHHVLNLRTSWKDWFFVFLISIRHFLLPHISIWRHEPPQTTSYTKILSWICCIVAKAFLPIMAILYILFAFLGAALNMFWIFTGIYVAVYLSIILSIATHEAGHLAYVRWQKGSNCGFVATRGPLVYVVCPKLKDKKSTIIASLIGPISPIIIALLLAVYHFVYGSWIDWFFILIFGIHILQFIFPNQDIRNVIGALREQKSLVS
ncbi:MAG: hypothetical protein GFH24_608346n27 [Chloroflexi bacterium AL-N5]|nr:hypothetical protein [Chloroflexi bacterium AL-N5]